jgi:hypothetical protein
VKEKTVWSTYVALAWAGALAITSCSDSRKNNSSKDRVETHMCYSLCDQNYDTVFTTTLYSRLALHESVHKLATSCYTTAQTTHSHQPMSCPVQTVMYTLDSRVTASLTKYCQLQMPFQRYVLFSVRTLPKAAVHYSTASGSLLCVL